MQTLEQKLARAQCAIATLQAQHNADKSAMESMANDIAEVLSLQEDMGCRLDRLDESEQSLRLTAGKTRELVTDLAEDHPSCGQSAFRTLADELDVSLPSPLASKSKTLLVPDTEVEYDTLSPLAHKSKPLPALGEQLVRCSPVQLSLSSHMLSPAHTLSVRTSSTHPLSGSTSPPWVPSPVPEVPSPAVEAPQPAPLPTVRMEDARAAYIMVPLRFLTNVRIRVAPYWLSTTEKVRRSAMYYGDVICGLYPLVGDITQSIATMRAEQHVTSQAMQLYLAFCGKHTRMLVGFLLGPLVLLPILMYVYGRPRTLSELPPTSDHPMWDSL